MSEEPAICHCPNARTDKQELEIRAKAEALQKALRAKDAEKVWEMLANRSRADAERAAESIKADFAKAGSEEKQKLVNVRGLPDTELVKLTGQGFLKTKRFLDKHEEFAESVLDQATVEGQSASIYFREPDGDREKLVFVREDGQWKAWLTMPKKDR